MRSQGNAPSRRARALDEVLADDAAVARFWRYADRSGEPSCWLWRGGRSSNGYPRLYVGERDDVALTVPAHRFAWEFFVEPIEDELVIDHLCRVPLCVNPSHLEPVTNRTNILRGISPSALNARKTHCPQGHPYDRERVNGARSCRTCERAAQRARRRRTDGRGTPALWEPS